MSPSNRSHRISMSHKKKKKSAIEKGLLATGIDQYGKDGKYEAENKNSFEK